VAEAEKEVSIVEGTSLNETLKNAKALQTQMLSMKNAADKERQVQAALKELENSLQSEDATVLQVLMRRERRGEAEAEGLTLGLGLGDRT
jgi:hypothetical protein